MKSIFITVAAVVMIVVYATSASAACRNCSGNPAPTICEITVLANWDKTWHHIRKEQGGKPWWRMRSLDECTGGCITFKKNYNGRTLTCAPKGHRTCYTDPWGKQHVWTIDGIQEPPQ